MKPTGENVLVHEIWKRSSEILLANTKSDVGYTVEATIQELGPKVDDKNIVVGSTPFMSSETQPLVTKIIKGKNGDQVIERLAIYSSYSISATEVKK